MNRQGLVIWNIYQAQDDALVAHLGFKYVKEEGNLAYWCEYLDREMYRYNSLEDSKVDLLVNVHDELTTDMRVIPGRHKAREYWVAGSMLFHLPFLEESGTFDYDNLEVWTVRDTIGRR